MYNCLILCIPLLLLAVSTFVELYLWRNIISKYFKIYLLLTGIFFSTGAVYFLTPNPLTYYVTTLLGITTMLLKTYIFYKNRYKVNKKYGNPIVKDTYTIMGILNSEIKKSIPIQGVSKYREFIEEFAINSNGLLVMGYDGSFKYVNNTFCKYLEKNRTWFQDKNLTDVIDSKDLKETMEFWENNKEGSKKQDFINHWTIEGREYVMHWILFWNDNEEQVSYCVLKVR